MPLIDAHNHIGVDLQFYLEGKFPYAQQGAELGGALLRQGFTHAVVFPMVHPVSRSAASWRKAITLVDWPESLDSIPYAWENLRLARETTEWSNSIGLQWLPFAMIDPGRQPEGQARHLRSLLRQHKLYGLKLQGTLLRSRVTDLAGPAACLLEVAREHNLPVLIHSSIDPSDEWSQTHDILDLAEQFPQIRFCLAHNCRFHAPSLERLAELPNAWFDCSAHVIHCQCACQNLPAVAEPRERFRTDYSNPAKVLLDLATAFPRKLIYGSDSPFYSYISRDANTSYRLISSLEQESACLQALPENLREMIGWRNPRDFLGVPLD